MLLLRCIFILYFLWSVEGHEERKPTLILISFDGFRWDYLKKVNTTTLSCIARNGVSATVVNNFVTRTFPNHYSIVTGKYEENHGIINNVMWDPVYKEWFRPSTVDPKWYNSSEPIWITNEKHGNGRLSAVINWVGGSVPIEGRKAHYSPPYNKSISFKTRVDIALQLLDQDPPVNFVAVYFHEPDASGHQYGPNSEEVIQAILNLDQVTGYLVAELKKRHLFDEVDIILTSDHGMAEVNSSKVIFLDDYISADKYRCIDIGVNAFIIPHKGEEKNIYKNLSKVPHMTVFNRIDIPKYWHYANNRRVTPIFVTSDLGYRIAKNRKNKTYELGNHGYNNSFKEMHPFFIAHGPSFKKGYQSESFSIVNIYPLMCHILGIASAPNDGNYAAVSDILQPKPSNNALLVILMVVSASIILLMICGLLRNHRKKPIRFRQFYRIPDMELDS